MDFFILGTRLHSNRSPMMKPAVLISIPKLTHIAHFVKYGTFANMVDH